MSTDTNTAVNWRLMFVGFTAINLVGASVLFALTLGAADPPVDPVRVLSVNTSNFPPTSEGVGQIDTLPYTILASSNEPNTWGLWLLPEVADIPLLFVINEDGYGSAFSTEPDWTQFIHINRNGDNRLYLRLDDTGSATFRINNEIFATSQLDPTQTYTFGVIYSSAAPPNLEISGWTARNVP